MKQAKYPLYNDSLRYHSVCIIIFCYLFILFICISISFTFAYSLTLDVVSVRFLFSIRPADKSSTHKVLLLIISSHLILPNKTAAWSMFSSSVSQNRYFIFNKCFHFKRYIEKSIAYTSIHTPNNFWNTFFYIFRFPFYSNAIFAIIIDFDIHSVLPLSPFYRSPAPASLYERS